MAQSYVKAADLPQVIPVFPLRRALLLPRGQLPLNIFEPRYLNMIDDAMAGDRIIGMIQTRPAAAATAADPVGGRLRGPDHQFRRDLGRPLSDHPDRLRRFRLAKSCPASALSPGPRRLRRLRGRPDIAPAARTSVSTASACSTPCSAYLEPARPGHRLGHRRRRAAKP